MSDFTSLETAVLAEICSSHAERTTLRQLLATGRAGERENTGHGFFTTFEVERTNPSVPGEARGPIYGPNLEVKVGAQVLLMGFLLWLDDGYPDCLEGYQYGTPEGAEIDLKSEDLSSLSVLGPME